MSFAGLPGFDIWPVYGSGQISPVFIFVHLCTFLVLTFLPGLVRPGSFKIFLYFFVLFCCTC